MYQIGYYNIKKTALEKCQIELQQKEEKGTELISYIASVLFNEKITYENKIEQLLLLFPIGEEITLQKIIDNFQYVPGFGKEYLKCKKSFNKLSISIT